MAENVGLNQGEKNPILFPVLMTCFDDLAALQASSPFYRANTP